MPGTARCVELSMGMERAISSMQIAEGATIVRVGSAIFANATSSEADSALLPDWIWG